MRGRNEVKGRIKQISDDGLVSRVRMDIDECTLTSLIITERVKDFGFQVGDEVRIMIEAGSVLIDKNPQDTDQRVT
ncbi:MAG TPA: TOBE domain-containing protein [Firmicutes bacterium]|nr:TOBE domain-containing protein [Bacillota bacterium]